MGWISASDVGMSAVARRHGSNMKRPAFACSLAQDALAILGPLRSFKPTSTLHQLQGRLAQQLSAMFAAWFLAPSRRALGIVQRSSGSGLENELGDVSQQSFPQRLPAIIWPHLSRTKVKTFPMANHMMHTPHLPL